MSGTTTTVKTDPMPATAVSIVSEWGAVIVSVLVSVIFLASLYVVSRAGNDTLLTTLITTVSSGFTLVIGYWLGSSRGSAKKTDVLAASQPVVPTVTTTTSTP